MKSITTKTTSVVAVAAAAAIGVGAVGVARADDGTTATPSPTSTSAPGHFRGTGMGHLRAGGMGHGARLDELASALASRLGVDETKVKSALTAARAELKGTFKSQRQKGERPTEADRTATREAFATAVAKQLGIDAAKVTSALADVEQQFRAQRFAEHEADLKARLDQAVTDGKLTLAEADAVLKAAKAGIIGVGGGRD